ncbi:hypothetical protein L2E82_27784 [Cichorium intybus]|uniref:Uncharacterized protein n=1 Tax=Cichorium intybus TaxID=13427 RepID=A0ACB9CUK7_CICIN|nr:hypothetical protein L2E82_27784 [Cichorium intybus]
MITTKTAKPKIRENQGEMISLSVEIEMAMKTKRVKWGLINSVPAQRRSSTQRVPLSTTVSPETRCRIRLSGWLELRFRSRLPLW